MEKKVKNQTYRLEFSIATANTPDLIKAAELIQTAWHNIGAKVDIKPFDFGDLNQFVLTSHASRKPSPRKFKANSVTTSRPPG